MNYVGIVWAYGRAAFCAMGEGGEIAAWQMLGRDEPFKPHRRSGGVAPARRTPPAF